MLEMYRQPYIKGFTTNPTLMRKAGVADYRAFARAVLRAIPDRPISFEVFSDDFDEMILQALEIASWGPNVNVKVPVTDTRGTFAGRVISQLSRQGVFLNVTALMTVAQVRQVLDALEGNAPAFISVFAGRVADTGRDPMPLMAAAVAAVNARPATQLIWASPRELLNIYQADAVGCHIITATGDILNKLGHVGKDLDQFSRETVEMFARDAAAAGFTIAHGVQS
jgi:transaldolase